MIFLAPSEAFDHSEINWYPHISSYKMTTIQSPPAPDTVTAIPAFSTSAKEAFGDFLKANSSRYWITREKRFNIISWIRDNPKVFKTQHDYSQWYYAL